MLIGMLFTNQNLFSTNYLERRLPETGLWRDQEAEAARAFTAVKTAYQDIQGLNLGPGEEANLEDRFVRPIFKALGFTWQAQPVTQRGSKKKRPDYALFASEAELKEARKDKGNLSRFFSHALAIAEAKYWDRPLNNTVKDDTLDPRDATAQLVKYLEDVHYHSEGKILWGILTNGKLWRLFYYRAASRSGNYYEVDLEEILRSGNADAFKYFYLFFARDAFVKDPHTGKTWLDQHLEGSETYARDIGEKLKERIFDHVFERLAEGFLDYRRNEAGIKIEDEASLKEVFNGCLTLLYRLLFILYAESRELLPVSDEHRYYRYSLRKLEKDVTDDLRQIGLGGMSRRAYSYWSRLESLCRIIDKGDRALNVPIYNGGLFQSSVLDEDQSPEARAICFVRDHKLADPYLAEAIEALTVDDTEPAQPGQVQFIDYSSLGVRHLGDIYEGLLEFHVRIAKEEMAEVREKGRSVWKLLGDVKGARTYRRKNPGEVYIENSRHERRATGSYFTPHYIVEYIVKNTAGPRLEERLSAVEKLLKDHAALVEKSRRQRSPGAIRLARGGLEGKKEELFDTLFSIKVLDPAMGSGHFLVYTVDFIADRIISFLANYPENPVIRRIEEMRRQILEDVKKRQGVEIDEKKLTDINLIKRMVMKRCIYGVDLNPMAVELAKLSLWLDSFTLGAPLSFLDHHLKCGNSLIGARDVQAQLAPGSERRSEFLRAMANLLQVAGITDATASEVEQSRQLYREAVKWLHPTKERVNVQIAKHFIPIGNEGKVMDWAYRAERETDDPLEKPHLENFFAAQSVAGEKRFFHWELEFPEAFFEGGGGKESLGFDVVIGNPPWGAEFDPVEKSYFRRKYAAIIVRMIDSFLYFLTEGLNQCKQQGFIGLVLPSPLLTQVDISKLRKKLLDETWITRLVNLGDFIFGADLANPSCILVAHKSANKNGQSVAVLDIRNLPPVKKEQVIALQQPPARVIPQSFYMGTHNYSFITKGFENSTLVSKLRQASVSLKDLISGEIQRGISADYAPASIITGVDIQEKSLEKTVCKKVITGHNVARYLSHFSDEYIIYLTRSDDIKDYSNIENHLTTFRNQITCPEVKENKHPWYALHRPRNPDLFKSPKLVGLTTTDRLIVAPEFSNFYAMDNLYIIRLKRHEETAYLGLLSLLNSTLLSFIYRYLAQEEGRVLPQVKAENLYSLPIRNIDVTTPEKERARLLEKGEKLYERCLAKGDQACVLGFMEHALKQTPEQADVVHDLLAFLAERMIEMNKAKQTEARGFLGWLEREIGFKIDGLKNKTRLRDYHEDTFEGLLEVLKENRRSLTIDPSRREFQDRLEKEYNNSLTKLSPLKARIEATDRLIDQVVYRLYGLTETEVAIIEGT